MKKVSAKKYFKHFDKFVFNNNPTKRIDYPSKNEVIWEYYDSNKKLISKKLKKHTKIKKVGIYIKNILLQNRSKL